MEKYSRLRDLVSQIPRIELLEAPAATDTQILYAHDASYIQKVVEGRLNEAEQKEIGFPWSEKMVERSRRSAGATIAAAKIALKEGVSGNLAGGTHHAYSHRGSGFCVFNDSAIAARTLQREINPKIQVAIVDLDVHQGNGTAAILQNDDSIFTLSIHGENNFPFQKEISDLDLGLDDDCDDQEYLTALSHSLDQLQNCFRPDFIIYLAGADPHEEDRLGRLKISKSGMLLRDETVFAFAQSRQVPIAFAMAGGYGKTIASTVEIHYQTVQTALRFQTLY
jgi:acetoin utilization deacetylase AcuC-like enzyme